MSAATRIGLGTVQFGLDYGITNAAGRVPEPEVRAILDLARDFGVDTLDTAHLYGSSEEAIGAAMPAGSAVRIVTKTPKFDGVAIDEAPQLLREAFLGSLHNLRQPSIHALLLHDPADLLGPLGDSLWAEMEALKAQGLIRSIGVSVYEGSEVDAALDRYPVNIVQLPWNPIDARLTEGGQLRRLSAAGVEVHARSLFLQGLLLQPLDDIPAGFGPIRDAVADLDSRFAAAGLGRLEGIVAAAIRRSEIDRFVVGVTSTEELRAILLAAKASERVEAPPEIPTYRGLDGRYLNPARWPELG